MLDSESGSNASFDLPVESTVPASKVRLSEQDHVVIRTELQKLGPEFTPSDVLRAASDPSNPLHAYFEWDDAAAAHEYRLSQARYLVQTVKVVIEQKEDLKVRAYVSCEVEGQRVYTSRARVKSDEELRAQTVSAAIGELRGWCRRYADFDELQNLRDAITSVVSTHESEVEQ